MPKQGQDTAGMFLPAIPSAVLRAPDDEKRHSEFARLVDDLRVVAKVL